MEGKVEVPDFLKVGDKVQFLNDDFSRKELESRNINIDKSYTVEDWGIIRDYNSHMARFSGKRILQQIILKEIPDSQFGSSWFGMKTRYVDEDRADIIVGPVKKVDSEEEMIEYKELLEESLKKAREKLGVCHKSHVLNELSSANFYAKKRGEDITDKIDEILGKELFPDLVKNNEQEIEGISLISFDEYKEIGGKMSKENFEKVKRVYPAHRVHEEGWKIVQMSHFSRINIPSNPEIELLGRISIINPALSVFQKMQEMYFLQGKK